MPCFLVFERFVKNDTVTGIIGNTQGVINAIKPPKNPNTKTIHALDFLLSFAASPQAPAGGVVAVTGNNIWVLVVFLPFTKKMDNGISFS